MLILTALSYKCWYARKDVVARICLTIGLLLFLIPAPASALPPRPDGGGNSSSENGGEPGGDGAERGAQIELRVLPGRPGFWTIVQWLDQTGQWLDVTGWQSPLEGESLTWWVDPANFGQGPFRWVVYDNSNRANLLGSQEFFLPEAPRQLVKVNIVLIPLLTPTPTLNSTVVTSLPVKTEPVASVTSTPRAAETRINSHKPSLQENQAPTLPTLTPVPPSPTPTMLLATPAPTASPSPTPSPSPMPSPTLLPSPTSSPTPWPSPTPETLPVPVESPMPPLESQPTAALASLPLMVSQVASAVEVKPGQEITWTLTMRNPGDVTVEGIVLSDIPSSGLIYLGSSVSQGQIQTVGEPPIMVVNVGDIPPQGQIEILLRTAIPVEAEPKQEFTNFASYNSRDLSVGTFNEVKVVVSEMVERVDLTLVMDAIDPRMFWGKVIWGTIFVGFIGLVGYIRSRHRGRARQTD